MKIFWYILILFAFLLVTFFGLGPVLMADGSIYERVLTLIVVILLYALLAWFVLRVVKHRKKS